MKHSSFQREGHCFITSRTTEENQETESRLKECWLCTHPDPYQQPKHWTTAKTFLTKSPWVRTQSFLRHQPIIFPFALQIDKATLFPLTPNSGSKIRFCISIEAFSTSISLSGAHIISTFVSWSGIDYLLHYNYRGNWEILSISMYRKDKQVQLIKHQ